jgi:pyruvate/2-oxoglutarate dehydrogenase complex dihydrolipoamide acyltransferase (E2) component
MYIAIAAHLARTLGWQRRQRVAVQRNVSAGLMRLALSDDTDRTYSLHGTAASGSLAVMPRPPGLGHLTGNQAAEAVEHRIEDGALILAMPAWAIPPGLEADATPKAPPPAPAEAPSPPPLPAAAKPRAAAPYQNPRKAEAVGLLEAGESARKVAGDMGLPLSDVANWAAEVRARKQGAAA